MILIEFDAKNVNRTHVWEVIFSDDVVFQLVGFVCLNRTGDDFTDISLNSWIIDFDSTQLYSHPQVPSSRTVF